MIINSTIIIILLMFTILMVEGPDMIDLSHRVFFSKQILFLVVMCQVFSYRGYLDAFSCPSRPRLVFWGEGWPSHLLGRLCFLM